VGSVRALWSKTSEDSVALSSQTGPFRVCFIQKGETNKGFVFVRVDAE
jgi:hypothetical protein